MQPRNKMDVSSFLFLKVGKRPCSGRKVQTSSSAALWVRNIILHVCITLKLLQLWFDHLVCGSFGRIMMNVQQGAPSAHSHVQTFRKLRPWSSLIWVTEARSGTAAGFWQEPTHLTWTQTSCPPQSPVQNFMACSEESEENWFRSRTRLFNLFEVQLETRWLSLVVEQNIWTWSWFYPRPTPSTGSSERYLEYFSLYSATLQLLVCQNIRLLLPSQAELLASLTFINFELFNFIDSFHIKQRENSNPWKCSAAAHH